MNMYSASSLTLTSNALGGRSNVNTACS